MIQVESPFSTFRAEIGFSTPCQIKITAPPENIQFAATVAQLAGLASRCATFGPFSFEMDPDIERDTMSGMIPDVIIFHAIRENKEATHLFINLGNYLNLKRSYEIATRSRGIPAGNPEHTIWLQFGSKSKWNSQLTASSIQLPVQNTVRPTQVIVGAESETQTRIREHLGVLLAEGDKIESTTCGAEADSVNCKLAKDKWESKVGEYLKANLGSSYQERWKHDTRHWADRPSLEMSYSTNMLSQFIAELK